MVGLLTGVVSGGAFGVYASAPTNVFLQLLDGLALGGAYGLAIAVLSALVGPNPSAAEWRPFRHSRLFAYRFSVGFVFGLPYGCAYGAVRGAMSDGRGLLYEAAIFGLAAAVVFAIVAGVSAWFGIPADVEVASPRSTLKADRTAGIVRAVTAGTATAIAAFFALGVRREVDGSFVILQQQALLAAAALGVMITAVALALTPWGRFAVSRLYLAAIGHTPFRWVKFLEDAHSRGVLRQTGAAYQFRHNQLLLQLADSHEGKRS
jgi:hypothetical protein